jgi:hypothetical protein
MEKRVCVSCEISFIEAFCGVNKQWNGASAHAR